MRLNDYISAHDLTRAELAKKIGVTYETARRYLTGERVPKPRIMQKIKEVTKGKVTPNDFYPTEDLQ